MSQDHPSREDLLREIREAKARVPDTDTIAKAIEKNAKKKERQSLVNFNSFLGVITIGVLAYYGRRLQEGQDTMQASQNSMTNMISLHELRLNQDDAKFITIEGDIKQVWHKIGEVNNAQPHGGTVLQNQN